MLLTTDPELPIGAGRGRTMIDRMPMVDDDDWAGFVPTLVASGAELASRAATPSSFFDPTLPVPFVHTRLLDDHRQPITRIGLAARLA